MLVSITYNCCPDSLGDVTQEDFVDAFENGVRARSPYRDTRVEVTFNSGASEIKSVSVQGDDSDDPQDYDEEFTHYAEQAFLHAYN